MTIETVSYDSIILYFKKEVSEEVLEEVQRAYFSLKELKSIIDITPSYCSILVQYDIYTYDDKMIRENIFKQLSKSQNKEYLKKNKLIKIPTDYSQNLDIARVAKYNKLTVEEVIELHTQTTYRVYAIGFMVGFAYLATVDKRIITPRLESPRKKVPKGSVGIADNQTAVYPQNSAGGWNIIGHTEFNGFHTFEVGDKVQFERV